MNSRSTKYNSYDENLKEKENHGVSRSERNSRLYKTIANKYGDLDNLPIEENTSEINMTDLKKIVSSISNKRENVEERPKPILERKSNHYEDNQKKHDINELLERAKYENNKLKEPIKSESSKAKEILKTLQTQEISIEEIKKACEKYEQEKYSTNEEDLSMTREMRFKTREISKDPEINQIIEIKDKENPLELFEDLKPTEDTIITEPIKENEEEADFHSENTKDIDIIKKSEIDDDFYTNSYKFKEKDFQDEEEFFEDGEMKSYNLLKIILLVITIALFAFAIYYFIKNYGIGIQ